MKSYADKKSQRLEASMDALFTFAEPDRSAEEQIGCPSYSYWGSTLRSFCRKKLAIILAVLLVLLVAFTIIQPMLPGQRDAGKVNNYPMTGLQINNMAPTADNCMMKVGAGIELTYQEVDGYPDWLAVTNALAIIPKCTDFTIAEYGDDWCKAEYNGQCGYILNSKLILPEDTSVTPFQCKSNFNVTLFSAKADYTNPDGNSGGWLYVKRSEVEMTDDGTVITLGETKLRAIPSGYGFLFGTNSIGQDLWARVWSGTRTSLYIGFMVAVVEVCLGTLIGMLWGYVRALDHLLTEIYNVLNNIPTTIVLILIAYMMKPSVGTLIFSMCLTSWMGMALFVRNQIIIIRDRDYNIASRCLGAAPGQIMLKNLLPYLVSVIMLRMVLAIPCAIGNEVFITYIGLGVPLDTPSLGNLINEGRKLLTGASALRYQLLFPMAVLSIITISFYTIGNAFADAADPKNHL